MLHLKVEGPDISEDIFELVDNLKLFVDMLIDLDPPRDDREIEKLPHIACLMLRKIQAAEKWLQVSYIHEGNKASQLATIANPEA